MDAWRQTLHRLRLERAWGIGYLRRNDERAQALLAQQMAQAQEQQQAATAEAETAAAERTETDASPDTEPAAERSPGAQGVDAQVSTAGSRSIDDRKREDGNRREVTEQRLAEMAAQVATCARCPGLKERRNPAFSDGTPFTPLMFVGEAPGEQEDRAGVPFVGKAGQKLTEMIEKGLAHAIRQVSGRSDVQHVPRSSVYIANVLKCRPPGNRDPEPEEVENCREYLSGQIELVQPVVICALGKPASRRLLGRDSSMRQLRGKRFSLPERPEITVVPTYHPSFLLHQYTPENRRAVMEDITEVVRVLHEAGVIPWWT